MKSYCFDHKVRLLGLILCVPAIAFLIPYGVNTKQLAPTLGLIPMALSALIAVMHITGKARYQPINILLDIFTACLLIGILIPGWVFLAEGRTPHWFAYGRFVPYGRVGNTMLGTYGTMPLMINFIIHTYFGLRDLYAAWRVPSPMCPHCHGRMPARNGGYAAVTDYDPVGEETAETHPHDSKDSFHSSHGRIALKDDEPQASDSEEPRPSTDDETARLV